MRSSPASAAFSVCHGSVAHLTRTGNSRTPEKTASLPSSGAPGFVLAVLPRDQVVEALEEGLRFRARLPLQALGHHRGGRRRDRAARPLEADVFQHVVLEPDEHGLPVAAERVVALRSPVRASQLAEVPRPLAVVEDHFLVEVAQLAHQRNILWTFRIPATSASISARVL